MVLLVDEFALSNVQAQFVELFDVDRVEQPGRALDARRLQGLLSGERRQQGAHLFNRTLIRVPARVTSRLVSATEYDVPTGRGKAPVVPVPVTLLLMEPGVTLKLNWVVVSLPASLLILR